MGKSIKRTIIRRKKRSRKEETETKRKIRREKREIQSHGGMKSAIESDERRKKHKEWIKKPDLRNYIEYKRVNAIARRTIRRKRKFDKFRE